MSSPFDDIDQGELRFENEILTRIEEFFSGFHHSLFDVNERELKPLYKIEVKEDEIRVFVDLPFVESKRNLTLSSTGQTLVVEAKTRKPVSLMVGGPYQRRFEFQKYCAAIELPRRVNPSRAKAKFNNGILVVTFPLVKSSRMLKID